MGKRGFLIMAVCLVCAISWMTFPVYAAEPAMVIRFDVTSKAQLMQISISHGKWANNPAVWIKAKIKNVSDQPIQYKTKCYFDGTDINRGFMVPKVGKPLIKPGAQATAKFPFPSAEIPKKFTIKVEDFSLE